jgi:hypothetical protein
MRRKNEYAKEHEILELDEENSASDDLENGIVE